MKKLLRIANIIAFVITIIVNYLSNTGIFNGNTMSTVSAKYQNLFTPAGYAFSIWGLIYLFLLGFIIYQARSRSNESDSSDTVSQIGWWFVISCGANSLWVVAWLYGYIGISVLLMLTLLFSLLQIILRTDMEMYEAPFKRIAFVWWPFCFYAGWITVATIANIAAYLTKLDWNGFGIGETSWAIMMICIAGLIALFVTWSRNLREFAIVVIWGLVAVAVANWNTEQSVSVAALAVSSIIFLSTTFHAYKNRMSISRLFNLR